MNIVRLDFTHPGIAKFQVTYGKKTAWIEIDGLETTGAPEEASIPWEPFYRKCLEELFAAIQAGDTRWTNRGS